MLHCHNLHGGYFDLRELARFSKLLPVVLTLHDEWAYTGHCAYTFGCERWRSGCGQCPHLDVSPSIRRDASAANWTAKYDIYRSEEHTSELQSLMRISYAVFCLKITYISKHAISDR